jgi:hypothetical protein
MNYSGKPEYEIRQVSDYFHVVCVACGEACELDYRGYTGAIPQIEITCPKCGSTGHRKLHMGGHGFGEKPKWHQFDAKTPPEGAA